MEILFVLVLLGAVGMIVSGYLKQRKNKPVRVPTVPVTPGPKVPAEPKE